MYILQYSLENPVPMFILNVMVTTKLLHHQPMVYILWVGGTVVLFVAQCSIVNNQTLGTTDTSGSVSNWAFNRQTKEVAD